MPTIRIQALTPIEQEISGLLTNCTAAAANALDIPQDWCWALFQPVEPGTYAEGARVWGASDVGRASVLISISALEGRTPEQKAAVLSGTARSAAEYLGLPLTQVFADYRDIPKGQVFSGGEIV